MSKNCLQYYQAIYDETHILHFETYLKDFKSFKHFSFFLIAEIEKIQLQERIQKIKSNKLLIYRSFDFVVTHARHKVSKEESTPWIVEFHAKNDKKMLNDSLIGSESGFYMY